MQKINLILIDDHAMILDGLESLFANKKDIKIVAKLSNLNQVKEFCDTYKPSAKAITIALCDLSFKHKELTEEQEVGFEIVKTLSAANKDIKSIIYSMHNAASYVQYALSPEVGAVGYLLKDSDKSLIFEAINSVATGNVFVQSEIARSFIKVNSILQVLTAREKTIANYVAMNFSTEEIAEKLCIAKRTVENYISHLYDKTGSSN